ncbi:putative bifunctional diguanylate cyclase/phosphodiesterase [Actinoplanes derwentensis]|uniref:EAL domain, c-di-GMP-specific phosphodiesterase class I (Or its enzymatically inactive variant) n=1 Tax=Actinoplanes derwentensis TaxID=113562 RepID=A0A1H1YM40_9ACTN|nr:GGDEF domain-containing phosphodiesterase [Actinoplanes derwentensis]SDT22470.1 EAL domain, c-di-GMP-specific phosphodiesterase class I (or its enzymatically inactive variant) [Actinoplanes derwentensis]
MRRVRGTGATALPRAVLLLLLVLLAAQGLGWIRPGWYPMVLGGSLAVIDALGVFYLLRVARLGLHSLSCRVAAVARGLGVLNALLFLAWAFGGPSWVWWVAASAHAAGMALLGFSTVLGPLTRLSGPHRQAFVAEMVAVGAAAVMIIWCVGLDPALWSGSPDKAWIILAGMPLAGLMLAMAIAAMLLRGVITHWRDPISVLLGGMALAIVTDTAWVTGLPAVADHAAGPGGGIMLVTTHVLLTLSPLMTSSGIGSVTDRARRTGPPRWVAFLPLGALVSGVALLLGVIVSTAGFLRWSGLIVATGVMIAAVAVRQWLELSSTQARASRDFETGLASRAALREALAALVRARENCAVLAIAIPPGAAVPDALRSSVRADDLVARLSENTFGVLVSDAAVVSEATTVAQRILAAFPDGAIGVAVARTDEPAKTILRNAEIALTHAKRAGTATFVVYEASMNDRRAADAALAEALEGALQRDEFTVLYQPIVELATRRVVAVEALLRWHSPLHGDVSPGRFIPVAERSGDIVAIGQWVLEQACRQAVAWRAAGIDLTVTVNVSPRQLQEPSLARDVLGALDRTGLPAINLVVEVTESAMVNEAVEIAALRTIRAAGVRIAIDDFGTGYSSLQYLTRLPVDILKIDRSFVAQLDGTAEGSAIAEAIVRLAQILRLTTVAEGIEEEMQARELINLGSQRGQGFLFSRPVPADRIPELAADVTYTGFQQLSA